jgi:hypothetical protein
MRRGGGIYPAKKFTIFLTSGCIQDLLRHPVPV